MWNQWSFEARYSGPEVGGSACDLSFPSFLGDARFFVATAVHGPHDLQTWISRLLRTAIQSEPWDGYCRSVPDWVERVRLHIESIGSQIQSSIKIEQVIEPFVAIAGLAVGVEGSLVAFRRGDFEVLIEGVTALEPETVPAGSLKSIRPVAVFTAAFPGDKMTANDFVWCDDSRESVVVRSQEDWFRLKVLSKRRG